MGRAVSCPFLWYDKRMDTYIATFYSHYGAVHFKNLLKKAGVPAKTAPVPRNLSSSCGTCVIFESESPVLTGFFEDETEQIVKAADGKYTTVWRAKEG